MRKYIIEDIKINIATQFDGMIDCAVAVDIDTTIKKDDFLKEVNTGAYGIHLYLTDDGLYACSSYKSYYVKDERFNKFIDEIKIKNMVARL